MTITVKVVNTDNRESAVISVEAQNPDGSKMSGGKSIELKGGESTEDQEFYVHVGQRLVIREVSQ